VEAKDLVIGDKKGNLAYALVEINRTNARTKTTADRTSNPIWNTEFHMLINSRNWNSPAIISLWHHNTFSSDKFLGQTAFMPQQLIANQQYDQVLTLQDNGKDPKHHIDKGTLHLKYRIGAPSLDTFVFQVRQRVWSFGDFSIAEESGRRVFTVTGSWPMTWYLNDQFGRAVLDIKKRSFIAIQPSYDFYVPGTKQMLMSITHQISFGGARFVIEMPNDTLEVRGNIWDWTFTCYRPATNEVVACVNREWGWTDTYAVEIAPTENVPLMLACIIVIDHEEDKRRNNNNF